jgi:hypothetical protein
MKSLSAHIGRLIFLSRKFVSIKDLVPNSLDPWFLGVSSMRIPSHPRWGALLSRFRVPAGCVFRAPRVGSSVGMDTILCSAVTPGKKEQESRSLEIFLAKAIFTRLILC